LEVLVGSIEQEFNGRRANTLVMETYDKGEHIKAVFAHFGLAIYLSQILEHGIVNAMVCVDMLPKRSHQPTTQDIWANEIDSFMDRHFETTLGAMIRNLKRLMNVPDKVESILTAALKKRNFLAHHYFRERSNEFMSQRGKDKMIVELQNVQHLFKQADETLDKVIKPLRERYGLGDKQINEVFEELKSQIED
jgi:hypothetical protein